MWDYLRTSFYSYILLPYAIYQYAKRNGSECGFFENPTLGTTQRMIYLYKNKFQNGVRKENCLLALASSYTQYCYSSSCVIQIIFDCVKWKDIHSENYTLFEVIFSLFLATFAKPAWFDCK